MNNREIFRKNLNDLLASSGKLQKDLADYVGAKTTTVSGWTRGISYPRADAMEKIAQFFGVPTSRLVGQPETSAQDPEAVHPRTTEAILLAVAVDQMPKEQREQALNVFKAVFAQYANFIEKGKNDDAT